MITLSASYQKLFSDNIRIGLLAGARDLKDKFHNGLLPPEKMAIAEKLICNQYVVASLTGFFALLLIFVVIDSIMIIIKTRRDKACLVSTNSNAR